MAMAYQRMSLDHFREISAVCTNPRYQVMAMPDG